MNHKALIVDDESIMLDLLERILSGSGYQVTRAPNGEQAVKLLADNSYRVIITDLQMGATNGIDVVRTAKERDRESIVLIITSSYEATYAIEAFRSGADDYLLKPFSMTDLLERLAKQEARHGEDSRPQP